MAAGWAWGRLSAMTYLPPILPTWARLGSASQPLLLLRSPAARCTGRARWSAPSAPALAAQRPAEGSSRPVPADDPRIAPLLAALTLDEKAALCAGASLWRGHAVPRLGIPALRVTDGPNGARGGHFGGGATAACFPCGSALAATWSPALVEAVGLALGEEARTKRAHVLLGPTVNMHRSAAGTSRATPRTRGSPPPSRPPSCEGSSGSAWPPA